MPITYSLAPIPFWISRKKDGTPNVDGELYTYRDTNRDQLKVAYQDSGGILFHTDPLKFDKRGVAGPIYWADDEPYYLVEREPKVGDKPGAVIKDYEHYTPPQGGGAPVTTQIDIKNYIRNGQFRLNFGEKIPYTTDTTVDNPIAEGWWLTKSNNNATDKVSFELFPIGQTTVEGNPKYSARYQCTSVGAGGETYKGFIQQTEDVNLFSNETISVSIFARSPTNSNIKLELEQYFGDGLAASAPVFTALIDTTLTTSWVKYTATVPIPSISGKTIDNATAHDAVKFWLDLPLNAISDIYYTNVQIERGNKISPYEEEIINDEWGRNRSALLPAPAYDNTDKNKVLTVINNYPFPETTVSSPLLKWERAEKAGTVKMTVRLTPDDGWWECDGKEFIKVDYIDLFNALTENDTNTNWGTAFRKNLINKSLTSNELKVQTKARGLTTVAADVDTGFTITTEESGNQTKPVTSITRTGNVATATVAAATIDLLISQQAVTIAGATQAEYNGVQRITLISATEFTFIVPGAPVTPATGTITVQFDTRQITKIVTVDASTMTPGVKFFIYTLDEDYTVYYIIDGLGDPPAIPGKTDIKVEINSTDLADVVATATNFSLNNVKILIPDMRGAVPRGWSHGQNWKIKIPIGITRSGTKATATVPSMWEGSLLLNGDTVTISGCIQSEYNGSHNIAIINRGIAGITKFTYTVSGSPATPATGDPRVELDYKTDYDRDNRMQIENEEVAIIGDYPGSYQADEIREHEHPIPLETAGFDIGGDLALQYIGTNTTEITGFHETRMKNISVMYIIKY